MVPIGYFKTLTQPANSDSWHPSMNSPMSDGKQLIAPGDRIQTNMDGLPLDAVHTSGHMIVKWVEVKEDGTKVIWVRHP